MDDDFETIATTVTNGVATIKLDRPPVNAIDDTMRTEIATAVDLLRDDSVRVAIVTGSDQVFSVGADIGLFEEAQSWNTQEFRANSARLKRSLDGLEHLEKPVIAAINGTCVGGGLELALACDIRFASPEARIGFPENNIGLIPGVGGISRLVPLVGPGRAKDLIFTARLLGGPEAHEYGIVEHVDVAPLYAAREYANSLVERPPQALGVAKQVIDHARDTNRSAMSTLESLGQSTLIETTDHQEGVAAFREDREPEFTGE